MKWNNRIERRKFEKDQIILANKYHKLGMTEEQIQKMYEFDLNEFRSERIYCMHTQSLDIQLDDYDENAWEICDCLADRQNTSVLIDFSNRYWWIDELDEICHAAKVLSEFEKELITLYVYEGYTQKDIGEIFSCSQNKISRQINKIKNKLLPVQRRGV